MFDHYALIVKATCIDWGLKLIRPLDIWPNANGLNKVVETSWKNHLVKG